MVQQAEHMAVYPADIFAVTDEGRQELTRGATTLTAGELEILVQLDAKTTVSDIHQRLPKFSEWDVAQLIRKLLHSGFAAKASIEQREGLDFSYFFDAEKTTPTTEAMAKADLEADTGAPALRRDGLYVSIARRNQKLPPPAAGKKISVLAIDDDQQVLVLLGTVLKMEGYETRTAANLAEVLAALRRLPSPDLVLLDVHLPDVNGFTILERIKQHPVLKTIPVIMLTGEASREGVSRGLADGADGYITKPFDVAILRKGIKHVLGLEPAVT